MISDEIFIKLLDTAYERERESIERDRARRKRRQKQPAKQHEARRVIPGVAIQEGRFTLDLRHNVLWID